MEHEAPRSRRAATQDPTAGFTLVEVTAAAAVLAVLVLGLMLVLVVNQDVSHETASYELARAVAQARLDDLHGQDPAEVMTTLGAAAGGIGFVQAGLTTAPGESTVGLIEVLNEAEAAVALGRVVDLDEDGVFSETEEPHEGFIAAPVRVTLRFTLTGADTHDVRAVALVVQKAEGTP